MRRTKIVATIGPASRDPEVLVQMVEAGMDVARLNFSHGTAEEHAETAQLVRDAAGRAGRPVAILQDLPGPKLRIGPLEDDIVELKPGDAVTFACGENGAGTARRMAVARPELVAALSQGDVMYLADGAGLGVDLVALSFVRGPEDITLVREHTRLPLIAKIEKPQAVERSEAILRAADCVMVARGDLGIELPIERVPIVQKNLLSLAGKLARPSITATQMLDSMVASSRPTRAEVTDVANAILDGTDAVMLSQETAVG